MRQTDKIDSSMAQRIGELRLREKELIGSIRDEIAKKDPDCRIVYLPNLMPTQNVDYIFIAMEPSLEGWAKDEEDGNRRIGEGFRNFILTWEDFLFRYCITNYLSPSYYVTDVSQAAMRVRDADRWRESVYPRWVKLLREEIEIVGNANCRLVFVGSKVEKFLKPGFSGRQVAKTLLHYSKTAARYRKAFPRRYPKEFGRFKKGLSCTTILDFAKEFLQRSEVPAQIADWVLNGLRFANAKLTESRKELMFTYYKEFQDIRDSSDLSDF